MMLLSAVVLIIGFIALAGMVGRVSQLATQANREQNRPLLREVEPMLGAVNVAIDSTAAPTGKGLGAAGLTVGTAAYDDAVVSLLRHLVQVEAGQGFLMDWSLVCVAPTAPATQYTGYASVTLNDGALQVTVRSNAFDRPTLCSTLTG
ncbi:MAG: hypothetical protein QOI63_1478 [Thermoplasmata archaeon]|jgi:hypothetical protein|nr:hypothetical protein [Thermoplasmata archaeon]